MSNDSIESSLQRKVGGGGQFYRALGNLNFSPISGGGGIAKWGLKILITSGAWGAKGKDC